MKRRGTIYLRLKATRKHYVRIFGNILKGLNRGIFARMPVRRVKAMRQKDERA